MDLLFGLLGGEMKQKLCDTCKNQLCKISGVTPLEKIWWDYVDITDVWCSKWEEER